ncbi:hypothetical protein C8F04DRAFT_1067325 [Mycena alexandri]|uniref:F-box domain-containing protein n=1 Tax=Mycena alexandri TaxID=1745969 RepID=A0AAD6TJH6_9AGAR|nr:hypothetical protein C8F04DRAFT_1067325 [Mycena alexandri]
MLAKFKQRLHSRGNTAQKSAPVFSGIALLPSETLGGEIFPLVVHGKFRDDLWRRKLLALAGVCTQWRNIVHSTPLLWNQCICLDTHQFSRVGRFREERIVEKYFEAVRMCLTRSAPLPVSISIDWFALRGDRKDFARTVDIISDAAERIESLRTSIVGRNDIGVGILRALEGLPNGTLRALTTIDISFETDTSPHIDLMNAPHLRRVELRVGWNPIDVISIPWLQLTHVTLTAPPLACLAVLARCSNLVSAVLAVLQPMHTSLPDDLPLITATLMHLTSLCLSVSSKLLRAVGNLVLPALTTLELFMVWPKPAILSHLPLGNVRRLTLTMHGVVQTADLYALLRCTPGVTELKLTSYGVENTFLDVLRVDIPSTELLLPQLEMLRIHDTPIFSRHGSRSNSQVIVAFQAMIASRVSTGLRRLVYSPPEFEHSDSQLRDELMLAVAAFSVNGLHVEVL